MHLTLVSHVIEATRPTDWASVLAIGTEVKDAMAKQGLNWKDTRFSRLMAKNHHQTAQHATRDVFDWTGNRVAVIIEGWVSKE
jgi:hypothetical protein